MKAYKATCPECDRPAALGDTYNGWAIYRHADGSSCWHKRKLGPRARHALYHLHALLENS